MLSSREDWSLDFLELFREAIGQATESHNKFFRVFTASMSNGTHRAFERSKMESFRLALRQEFQLSLEIADIIDELHMLKRLLQEQMDALRQGEEQMTHILQMGYDPQMCFNVAGTLESLPEKISALWRTLKNDYLAQITRMIEDAERAQTSILNLLDLQQKQDNIDEAHSSNQTALLTAKQTLSSQAQTDATNAQSQILFMFTFVTIVFLPLSFFTSYYGMNVQNPSGDQLLRQTSYVWKIMGGATFPIILLLLIGGVTWYVWSKNRAKKERIEELAELMKNGAMPSGLFKEDDPVYEEIKQRAESIREAEDAKNTQEEGVLRKRRPTETV
jgi:Mg2+ and Co2+ transporter CorA